MRRFVLAFSLGALLVPFAGCSDGFRTVGFLDRLDTALPGGNAQATALGLGDLDGDGKLDAAVVSSRNEVNVFISKGDGFFATGTGYAVEQMNGNRSMTVADLNADGHPDVVVANGNPHTLNILWNAGDGRLTPFTPASLDAGGCQVVGVEVADLSGDGAPDLIVACQNPNEIHVLKSKGGMSGFEAPYTLSYGPSGQTPAPRQIFAADLDGNGQPDIVLGTETDLRILTNPGTSMTASISTPLPMRAGAVALGDVNGNGVVDVSVLVNQTEVRVFEYATGGNFSQLVDYQNVGQMGRTTNQGLGVGDFLKRGRGDFVVTLPNPSEVKLVVNRNEANNVTQPTAVSYQFAGATPGLTVSDNGFAVGDVTGDGLPDVVLRNGSNVSVLVNASLY